MVVVAATLFVQLSIAVVWLAATALVGLRLLLATAGGNTVNANFLLACLPLLSEKKLHKVVITVVNVVVLHG